MPARAGRLMAFIANHIGEIANPLNSQVLNLLVQTRRLFGGDMDKTLIMAFVLLRMNEHHDFVDLNLGELLAGEIDPLPSLPITIQSVADATDIPRESARRKVGEIMKLGWIQYVEPGSNLIRMTPQGYLAIEPVRVVLLTMMVNNVLMVEGLLARYPKESSTIKRGKGVAK